MSLLSVKNLSKSYRTRKVVKDVSLKVAGCEVIGLLGPNGAGKTTSFRMIAGLISANTGEIKLNGTKLTHLATEQRARLGLGYLPQDASVFRKLTVEENILAVLQVRKELTDLERTRMTESLMREFHITHVRASLGSSLSGGERRRTEIARALASEPEFILLDEPFAALGPALKAEMLDLVAELARESGATVLMVSHDLHVVMSASDRVLCVNGHICCEGRPEVVAQAEEYRALFGSGTGGALALYRYQHNHSHDDGASCDHDHQGTA